MLPDTGSAAAAGLLADGVTYPYPTIAPSSTSTAADRPNPSLVRRCGSSVRLRGPLQVHQHDHEQVQHDDTAGIDKHLDCREKLRAEQHVKRRDEKKIDDEEQHAVHRVLGADNEPGEKEHERRYGVKRDRLAHYSNITLMIPLTTRFAIASGIRSFHPIAISWSYR